MVRGGLNASLRSRGAEAQALPMCAEICQFISLFQVPFDSQKVRAALKSILVKKNRILSEALWLFGTDNFGLMAAGRTSCAEVCRDVPPSSPRGLPQAPQHSAADLCLGAQGTQCLVRFLTRNPHILFTALKYYRLNFAHRPCLSIDKTVASYRADTAHRR
jgi:hypothetical protein